MAKKSPKKAKNFLGWLAASDDDESTEAVKSEDILPMQG